MTLERKLPFQTALTASAFCPKFDLRAVEVDCHLKSGGAGPDWVQLGYTLYPPFGAKRVFGQECFCKRQEVGQKIDS